MSTCNSAFLAVVAIVSVLCSGVSSQAFSYSFVPYIPQCITSCGSFSVINHPHHLYDFNQQNTRSIDKKVADGLGVMSTITDFKSATEASGGPFIPNLEGMALTGEALRKLIRVVQQKNKIDAMPVRERILFEVPTAGLDSVAAEICSLIQSHLAGRYRPFNCTTEELKDLDTRLEFHGLMQQLNSTITNLPTINTANSAPYQCQYWNSRGLDNCLDSTASSPYPLTTNEYLVNEGVVKPAYAGQCSCCHTPGSLLNSPICEFSA